MKMFNIASTRRIMLYTCSAEINSGFSAVGWEKGLAMILHDGSCFYDFSRNQEQQQKSGKRCLFQIIIALFD